MTQLNFKNVLKFVYAVFTGTAHNSRDAATGFAAVATRPLAGCCREYGRPSLAIPA